MSAVLSRVLWVQWEMAAAEGLLCGQSTARRVVASWGHRAWGEPCVAREIAAIAAARGVEVFTAYCESHATDIPFQVVARLLRAVTGVEGLDAEAARAQVHAQIRDADPEDLLLLNDLLGTADAMWSCPRSIRMPGGGG